MQGKYKSGRQRKKALAEIRRDIAADRAKPRKKAQYGWESHSQRDHSELVRIFLFEKDVEIAWKEAKSGGCWQSLWLELANAREETHPLDSIKIYKARIDELLQVTDSRNYRDAVDFLEKVETILLRSGAIDDFQITIGNIRLEQKSKRNLMKLRD